MGLVLRFRNRLTEAQAEFEIALRLDSTNYKTHGNLGFIFFDQGEFDSTQTHFKAALRLNLADALAREGLADTLKAKSQHQSASR